MVVIYGKLEGSPLGESLGSDGRYDIGSSIGISGSKGARKSEGYPLGESHGKDGRYERDSSNGSSYGIVYGKLGISKLG